MKFLNKIARILNWWAIAFFIIVGSATLYAFSDKFGDVGKLLTIAVSVAAIYGHLFFNLGTIYSKSSEKEEKE